MPQYEFIDLATGERSTHYFALHSAPSIGKDAVIDGVKLRRIITADSVVAGVTHYPSFSSVQVPRGHPAIDKAELKRDKYGRPVFDGLRDRKKFEDACEELHEIHPQLPTYKFGELSESTQTDKDDMDAHEMRKLRMSRDLKEVCRGIGGIDVEKIFAE